MPIAESQSCCSARLKVAAPIHPPSHSSCSNTNSTFSTVKLESRTFSQVPLDFSTEARMQKTASLSYSPLFYSTVTLESTYPAYPVMIATRHRLTLSHAVLEREQHKSSVSNERCESHQHQIEHNVRVLLPRHVVNGGEYHRNRQSYGSDGSQNRQHVNQRWQNQPNTTQNFDDTNEAPQPLLVNRGYTTSWAAPLRADSA